METCSGRRVSTWGTAPWWENGVHLGNNHSTAQGPRSDTEREMRRQSSEHGCKTHRYIRSATSLLTLTHKSVLGFCRSSISFYLFFHVFWSPSSHLGVTGGKMELQNHTQPLPLQSQAWCYTTPW